jgi:hypothetical protein
MEIKTKHILVSYPRSGSNYFQLAWKEKNKQHIECLRSSRLIYKIEKDEKVKIIGLIRNPLEAISSRILMDKTYKNGLNVEDSVIDFSVEEYIKIYKFIINNADFIVDTSELKNVDKLIEFISGISSVQISNDEIKNRLINIPYYSYSFVGHEDYETTVNSLKNVDIELCQVLYHEAYAKRLVV